MGITWLGLIGSIRTDRPREGVGGGDGGGGGLYGRERKGEIA